MQRPGLQTKQAYTITAISSDAETLEDFFASLHLIAIQRAAANGLTVAFVPVVAK